MAFFNTREQFGSLVKILHGFIFILVAIQYILMALKFSLPEHSAAGVKYVLLHKSFGLIILVMAALMILSRQFGNRPPYPANSPYQNFLAKTVHFLLYACLILMPLGGIGMTIFSERPLAIFGFVLIPDHFVAARESLSHFCYVAHVSAAKILLALIALHTVGALYHHFVLKDNVLRRMF